MTTLEDVLARMNVMEKQLNEERVRGDALAVKVAQLSRVVEDRDGDRVDDNTIRQLEARVDAIGMDIFQVADQFPQLSSQVYAHSVLHIANVIRDYVSGGSRFRDALVELSEEDMALFRRSEGQIRNTPIFNVNGGAVMAIVEECADILLDQVANNGWAIVGNDTSSRGDDGHHRFLVDVIKRFIVVGCNQLERGLTCAVETISRLYYRVGWHITDSPATTTTASNDDYHKLDRVALEAGFALRPHPCATHGWCYVNGGCANGFPRGASTYTNAHMMSIAGFYLTTTCTLSNANERALGVFLLETPGTIVHYLGAQIRGRTCQDLEDVHNVLVGIHSSTVLGNLCRNGTHALLPLFDTLSQKYEVTRNQWKACGDGEAGSTSRLKWRIYAMFKSRI